MVVDLILGLALVVVLVIYRRRELKIDKLRDWLYEVPDFWGFDRDAEKAWKTEIRKRV